jgi:prepilin-type N-terminal cleavage/methylation domain-containing protein
VLTAVSKNIDRLESTEVVAGFSLVELMIVLSVLSILFAVGMPAFGRLLHDIEIRGSAEGLRAALQMARTEAVTRNARVRISFNDVSGRPAWTIGCVHASAHCPGAISTFRSQPEIKTRLGVARSDDAIDLAVALIAGRRLPSGVTFNALGAAPGVSAGVDASRIDVLHVANDQARRLVLTIAAAGTVRLCDPSAGNDATFRCN